MKRRSLVQRAGLYSRYIIYERLWPALYPSYLKLRTQLENKRIIHVIGDSHVGAFYLQYPYITHHIGAATAHNLINKSSSVNSREKIEEIVKEINNKRDLVLMVFGEIDCRIHIYKKYREEKLTIPLIKLVRNTVSRYGEMILSIRNRGVKICVLSVAPTSREENKYCYKYYADFNERTKITRIFNKELEEFCKNNKINFIDVHKKTVDSDGGISQEYALDEVHLNSLIVPYVTNEMENVLKVHEK